MTDVPRWKKPPTTEHEHDLKMLRQEVQDLRETIKELVRPLNDKTTKRRD